MPPVKKVLQCSKHPAKELDLYCESCEQMICRDCILKVHRNHQYNLASDAFPKHKDEIASSLQPVEQQLASVNKALEGLNTRCGQITDQRQTIETDIKRNIRQIHEALEARQEELITQLDQMTQQKMKSLAAQRDQLELLATQLKSCCAFSKHSLRTGSQVEILTMKKQLVPKVEEMTIAFDPDSLVPCEHADLKFSHKPADLFKACQQFGEVTCDPTGHEVTLHESEGPSLQTKGTEPGHDRSIGAVVTEPGHDRSIGAVVTEPGHDRSIRAVVTEPGHDRSIRAVITEPGHDRSIRTVVTEPGRNRRIRAGSMCHTTPTSIITGVIGPWGVAVNDRGQTVVAEREDNCISIFSASGKRIKTFGSLGCGAGQLNTPYGLALSATGQILVCEFSNHRVQVFSPVGDSVKRIGTQGNGRLQFNRPVGITVHPHTNMIYVADYGNNRVQILNANFTFFSTFGDRGSCDGKFINPYDIAFDKAGNVFVADSYNGRIQVFTAGGEYIRQFGKKGKCEGELEDPKGIAIDFEDTIYVCDWGSNRISLFTRDGHFLRSFGTRERQAGKFSNLSGIAIAKNGTVYVSDFSSNCVQVFQL